MDYFKTLISKFESIKEKYSFSLVKDFFKGLWQKVTDWFLTLQLKWVVFTVKFQNKRIMWRQRFEHWCEKHPFFEKLIIWRRNAAIYVVTAYAKYLFNRAREKADALYAMDPRMYYVASRSFEHDKLTIYDRERFKAEKSVYGCAARLLTLITLKNGCYYHTPDVMGNQKLTEEEIEKRLKYFIHERLCAAKLI